MKRKWIAAGTLLSITFILQALARRVQGFADWYARSLYPRMVSVVGRFFSLFPFGVAELGLYIFTVWIALYTLYSIYSLFWTFWKKNLPSGKSAGQICLSYCCTLAFTASFLLLIFTLFCGVNYHCTPFSQTENLPMEKSSSEELILLCTYLVEEINLCDSQISQDGGAPFEDMEEMKSLAVSAIAETGKTYESLAGYTPAPKGVWQSRILSLGKLTGIYSPFTIEANYNQEMPPYNIPAAMCHELSHLKGYMREDEANFIAWLACTFSHEPEFCYSGHMLALSYAMSALWKDGEKETYRQLYASLCPRAKKDLRDDADFWSMFDGPAAEVSQSMNHTYLKLNSQADGVKSYGRMTDLLLAYRRAAK